MRPAMGIPLFKQVMLLPQLLWRQNWHRPGSCCSSQTYVTCGRGRGMQRVPECVYTYLGGPRNTVGQTDGCWNECRVWSTRESDSGGGSLVRQSLTVVLWRPTDTAWCGYQEAAARGLWDCAQPGPLEQWLLTHLPVCPTEIPAPPIF